MGRVLFFTLLLFGLTVFAYAQEKPQAVKIDELIGQLGECDLGQRLDSLRTELANDSKAKGLIILYQSVKALPANYGESSMQRRIRIQMDFAGIDSNRVDFLFGGYKEKITSEIWLVPKGAENPKPTDSLPVPSIPTDKTFQYASKNLIPYYDVAPYEFLSVKAKAEQRKREREEELERKKRGEKEEINEDSGLTKEELKELKFQWVISSFGEILKKQNSKGLIIFYADNKEYSVSAIRKHIEEGKLRIAKESKISIKQIAVVYGGYGNYIQADFWVIPQGSKMPKPSPDKRQTFDE